MANNFKPVDPQINFVEMENEILARWAKDGIVEKYLRKNDHAKEQFSFLDGPITANNPMGMHHAWGRTYKDLWQRFWSMRGRKQRYQNGFDEQGLWVEVEVEKELGLKNKKEIENLVPGDTFASIAKFVDLCKERVKKFSQIQTEQSKRLGYFMDWENSYHTSSDKNNYTIWHFLKTVHKKGWLYKGHDSVPWCPRCGTAISQHEILTEEYKEITHETVFFKLPIREKQHEYLLVWTTTPWTIPANVAVAVNPKQEYVAVKSGDDIFWLMEKRVEEVGFSKDFIEEKRRGHELIGWEYDAPFDFLPLVKSALGDYVHRVIDGGDVVTDTEGTGLLHVAPGAGQEDFVLGRENKLPVLAIIEEDASYVKDMAEFSGQNAKVHPEIIIDFLHQKDGGKYLYKILKYKHRYPTCWRCKTELVWRVVDEWYIAMDRVDDSKKTYREQMIEVAKKIDWHPSWGRERELDWLKNMHDWLISKKRYWGLALPIWECKDCNEFVVIGGLDELKDKAVEGFEKFDGNSPHRPWIDQIKIACPKCKKLINRIPDVGNPWLDAGIVPYSTMDENWRPADFITESFPGQFKNWFYALIAMSTALTGHVPTKSILGFATMVDEKGEAFHKSKGNSIEFVEGANAVGADIIRWMCALHNPENDLPFGIHKAAEVRRRFYLILWNSYKYFVDYASLAGFSCDVSPKDIQDRLTVLDKWILARLTEIVQATNTSLEKYDAATAARAIEDFVINDYSTWYIRRSRDRVGPAAEKSDEVVCLSVMYGVLVVLSKLIAPFMPFVAEAMYANLADDESVHLAEYPLGDKNLLNPDLTEQMRIARQIVEAGHAFRKKENFKLRQPLASVTYTTPDGRRLPKDIEDIMKDELNVKDCFFDTKTKVVEGDKEYVVSNPTLVTAILDTNLTDDLKAEGGAREIIRQIQQARKEMKTVLTDEITVYLPNWPKAFEPEIKKQTLAKDLIQSDTFKIELA